MAVDKNPGQWEVVGGKPTKVKTKSGPVRNGTSNKGTSSNAPPALKVDELVSPLDTRFALLDPQLRAQAKKEALGGPEKPAEKSKSKAAPVKEAQKKKPASKEKEPSKEKVPKSLPDAIKQINVSEFNQLKETVKARFSGTPRFWLKEMTAYLNHHFNTDVDPTFSGKPRDYPSSLLSSELRGTITSTFSECGNDTLQAFYEESVLTMPTEINRGNKVVGTKLMLQLLSFHKPSLAVSTLPRYKEVLGSMESRVPACLSLLWVMSQAAVKDTSIGIQVWIEAMLPMIGLKNYAPFVGQVASQLTFKAKDVKSTKETVSVNDYFKLFDLVQDPSLPSAVRKDIESFLLNLTRPMTTSFGPKMFSQYLQRVDATNDDICRRAFDCLKADPRTFETWRKEYKSSMPKSAVLLKWAAAHETGFVRNSQEFRTTLFHFRSVNNSYSSSAKHPEALKPCTTRTEDLIASIQRPKKSKLSLKHVNYLLFFVLVGLVYYDIGIVAEGNWSSSRLGQAMDRYGVTEKVIQGYQRCQPYVQLVKEKAQPLIDNAALNAIRVRDLIYEKGELYFPGIWTEADKKYQMAVALVKEQANALAAKGTQYAEQGLKIANHYWQIAAASGAVYWQVAVEQTRDFWQTAAEKGAEYWQLACEKGAEYWLVFKQFSVVYVQKVSDFSTKVINEERVQQAWKYTYDMYHRAMHAVGLCSH